MLHPLLLRTRLVQLIYWAMFNTGVLLQRRNLFLLFVQERGECDGGGLACWRRFALPMLASGLFAEGNLPAVAPFQGFRTLLWAAAVQPEIRQAEQGYVVLPAHFGSSLKTALNIKCTCGILMRLCALIYRKRKFSFMISLNREVSQDWWWLCISNLQHQYNSWLTPGHFLVILFQVK